MTTFVPVLQMGVKVVILFLLSLCLTGGRQSGVLATLEHDEIAVQTATAVCSMTYIHSKTSEVDNIKVNPVSSNLNLSGSVKNKVYKTCFHLHGSGSDVLALSLRRACKHSRAISDMGLLRHLIFLEKILI